MKNVLIYTFLFLWVSKLHACQFVFSFCETLDYLGTLVETEIVAITDTSVIYELTEVIVNDEAEKIGTIEWALCEPNPCDPLGNTPAVGHRFLIILDLNQIEIESHHIITTYSFCETRALEIKNNTISLQTLEDGKQTLSYPAFKKQLMSICHLVTLGDNVKIIGNPNDGEFRVENQTSFNLSCRIYDTSGRLMVTFSIASKSSLRYSNIDLSSGCYFLRFSDGLRSTTKKFIKV